MLQWFVGISAAIAVASITSRITTLLEINEIAAAALIAIAMLATIFAFNYITSKAP